MLSSLNQNFDHHQMGVNKIWLPLDGYDWIWSLDLGGWQPNKVIKPWLLATEFNHLIWMDTKFDCHHLMATKFSHK
jgi:hypothetical protein